jgi:hypothetical protein
MGHIMRILCIQIVLNDAFLAYVLLKNSLIRGGLGCHSCKTYFFVFMMSSTSDIVSRSVLSTDCIEDSFHVGPSNSSGNEYSSIYVKPKSNIFKTYIRYINKKIYIF